MIYSLDKVFLTSNMVEQESFIVCSASFEKKKNTSQLLVLILRLYT